MQTQVTLKNKFRIYIYTTPGCQACRIMKNLVTSAVEDFINVDVYIENIGYSESELHKQKELNIRDFPTTRMYKGTSNKSLWELVGTYPKDYIKQVIDNSIHSI